MWTYEGREGYGERWDRKGSRAEKRPCSAVPKPLGLSERGLTWQD